VGALSYVGNVTLFDSDGVLLNSSGAWPVPAVHVGDRPYFKAFKTDPNAPDVLVEPVHSRITGAWTTVLARKLTGPNGEFLGVIGRGFEPVHFEKFFASVALGTDAAIAMLHRNATLLARYPHDGAVMGRNFRNGPLFHLIGAQPGPGTGIYVSPADGQERLGAAYGLENFPIFVVASTTLASALAPWREQMNFLIGVGGSSMLLIAGLLFVVVRRLSQDHQRSERRLRLETQRLDRAVNNMTQGLLLFDASQRLVVCNNRYIEMYGLSADVVKPGCSFRDVIAHRKATGSFVGDIEAYIDAVLRDIGRKKTTVIETSDGRFVQIVNEPLADGGEVATHEDITEQRAADARTT